MNDVVPKVFISYSWSCSDRVIELAERLVNDRVDVVLDKWELKEGQDKYSFMERCVTDDSISKVLMICDKSYADKANSRTGGVGDETMVISPEIYAKTTETKYLPVIFERDENGKEYVPTYLKARVYFDLSSDDVYEKGYEKLLRNLHNKPEYSKPRLGTMPEWLNEETVNLGKIRNLIKQIKAFDGKNPIKQRYMLKKFNEGFIEAIQEFTPTYNANFSVELFKQIDTARPLRDLFLDFVEILIVENFDIDIFLGDFFEQVYNGIYRVEGRNFHNENEFEFGFFILWEMIIGATAILLHFESYEGLRNIIVRTYFLSENPVYPKPQPYTFVKFRPTFHFIDDVVRPSQPDGERKFTFAGDIASKRERIPNLKTRDMANADVVLYQLTDVLNIKLYGEWSWFPLLYGYLGGSYSENNQEIWRKMISKRHCESLFPLFDVDSISMLKDAVQRNQYNSDMRYTGGHRAAPSILQSIELDKIATLP